jgi:hypothetical protein
MSVSHDGGIGIALVAESLASDVVAVLLQETNQQKANKRSRQLRITNDLR